MHIVRENSTIAITYHTTDLTSFRGVSRIYKFNNDIFPVSLVNNVFDNHTMNVVSNFSHFTCSCLALSQLLQCDLSKLFFGNREKSCTYIVSNPVIYTLCFSLEPLDLCRGSLYFWKYEFQILNSYPDIPYFIQLPYVLQKFNISNMSTFMQDRHYSRISQSQIGTNYIVSIYLKIFNNWNEKIASILSFNEMNSTSLVLSIKISFEHLLLHCTIFNWHNISLSHAVEFKQKWKGFALRKRGYNTTIVQSTSKFLNFWKSAFFPIQKLCIEFSPKIISFYNHIFNFLHGLRRHIKSVFNLFIEFAMQDILQIFGVKRTNKFFTQRIFKNVRRVNSCHGVVSVEKISNSKMFVYVDFFGNIEYQTFNNLHNNMHIKKVLRYFTQFRPTLTNGGSLKVVR